MYATMALILVIAQPPQAPPILQPEQAPPIVNVEQLLHEHAYEQAAREGKPLIRFVGVNARKVPGCVVVRLLSYNDDSTPRIIISKPNADRGIVLGANASEREIRDYALPEVSERAVPFYGKGEPTAQRDGSPWLSSSESDAIKAMWPRGVDFPDGLRFYFLRPLYQAMSTTNNGRTQINDPTPIEHEEFHPFIVSGGMAINGRVLNGWRSTKGLLIPPGKQISVWREAADVRAFALVNRWRWKFPVGAVAYDVLSTDKGIFEIRSQERDEDGWMTRPTFKDVTKAPAGYAGLDRSCASCHSTAGNIFDVAGRIYRRERWGSDGRFSWRPYTEDGTLDRRWPIEVH